MASMTTSFRFRISSIVLVATLFVGACTTPQTPAGPDNPGNPASPGSPPTGNIGLARQLTIMEWRKAENWDHCAPVVLLGDGGVPATERPAYFGGGWAVAFDTPTKRSAYGIAGVGLLRDDDDTVADKRRRLQQQWPYFKEPLASLAQPSFAGYGLEGGDPYPDNNPNGNGLDSLAYVRIAGQKCMYNVWSKVSRAHLEYMLDHLVVVEKPNG